MNLSMFLYLSNVYKCHPWPPFQRMFIISLKAEPSTLMGGKNKENRFWVRSFSETGERLKPANGLCLTGGTQRCHR